MKILVAIKRVLDPAIAVHVKEDESGVDISNEKKSINPFDEIAVEAAVQLKESGVAEEVVVVSAGTLETELSLRDAMAMGADRAILVKTCRPLRALSVAKILQFLCKREKPALVLCGKQSIDSDQSQVPQMLAGMNHWPQVLFASSLEINQNTIVVSSEVETGIEIFEMSLPAVVSVDLRLNEPRYLTLMNIMKAKNKPVEIIESDELGLDLKDRIKQLKVSPAQDRKPGVVLNNVSELINILKTKPEKDQ